MACPAGPTWSSPSGGDATGPAAVVAGPAAVVVVAGAGRLSAAEDGDGERQPVRAMPATPQSTAASMRVTGTPTKLL